jgi:O-antigen ligase
MTFSREGSLSDIRASAAPAPIASSWWTFPVFALAMCQAVLVYLPNRFNVPWAVKIAGWEFFPTDAVIPLLLVCAWLGRPSGRPLHNAPRKPALFPFLSGWLLVSLISTLISGDEGIDLSYKLACLFTVALWTLPLLIVPALGLERKQVLILLGTYAALGVAGGVLSSFQSLMIERFSALVGWNYVYGIGDSERRADLPLGVSTVISLFFATVLPIGFALFIAGGKKSHRAAGFLVMLMAGAGTIFTASRAAYILLFAVALVCVFWLRTPRSSKVLPALGFCALVILVGVALTRLNFERVTTLKDGSFGWRYRGIEASLDMMSESPLLGVGLETHFRRQHGPVKGYFSTEKPHDAIYYKNQIAPSDAHNLYLLLGAESGILGLGFFCAMLASLGWWWFRLQSAIEDPLDRLVLRVFLIAWAAALVHSLFGTDLARQARMAPLFWTFCGLGIAYGLAVERSPREAAPSQWAESARL